MKLHEIEFKRRFSVNCYHNLKLKLVEMSFYKDWVNDNRGDPYPVLSADGDIKESVGLGKYSVSSKAGGKVTRLLGEFFPYGMYEIEVDDIKKADVGFTITSPVGNASFLISQNIVTINVPNVNTYVDLDSPLRKGDALVLHFYSGGYALYLKRDNAYDLIVEETGAELVEQGMSPNIFNELRSEKLFRQSKIFVTCDLQKGGKAVISRAEGFLSCGHSQADIKPVRYEDGTPIIENGKVWMTMTSRYEMGGCQTVLSWNYTTCEFALEGALFFDVGDGLWCGDVAASVIYDRTASVWRIWYCSFSHNHILARGTSVADPRFGINVIDTELLPLAPEDGDRKAFAGFPGDEDPDLILVDGKWHLTICRNLPEAPGYHYMHFISDNPMDGFTYVDHTPGTEKTGGLFIPTDEGIVFACGSDFGKRAVYDVYPISDFTDCHNLKCDYDDGGFRGWGTIMMLPVGSRYQYIWLTFDRHNGSRGNWSYGNLHAFCSDTFKLEKK